MECFICGRQYDSNILFDAISFREIVKACESCVAKEGLVVVRRPTLNQLKQAETILPYYKKVGDTRGSSLVRDKTETTLRQVVDRTYGEKQKQKTVQIGKTPVPDLVDNFHWIIMRARRSRKITQEQLAQLIGESEAAVKMAEQGILPDDGYKLVKKLESFLGLTLVKSESAKAVVESLETKQQPQLSPQPSRILKFDRETMNSLRISDLRQMREAREKAEAEEIEFDEDVFDEAEKRAEERENSGNLDEEKE